MFYFTWLKIGLRAIKIHMDYIIWKMLFDFIIYDISKCGSDFLSRQFYN